MFMRRRNTIIVKDLRNRVRSCMNSKRSMVIFEIYMFLMVQEDFRRKEGTSKLITSGETSEEDIL